MAKMPNAETLRGDIRRQRRPNDASVHHYQAQVNSFCSTIINSWTEYFCLGHNRVLPTYVCVNIGLSMEHLAHHRYNSLNYTACMDLTLLEI